MLNPSVSHDEIARLRKARKLLFKGGVILTLDRALGDFAQGDMLVEDGVIRAIGPVIDDTSEDTVIVDARDRIVLPGFVDTHSHSYQGLLRGLLPNGVVMPDYDRDIQKNITAHYAPEDAYAGVYITALAMLDMGTTTMVDISQVAHSPEHIDANIAALRDSGMRAVFAYSRGMGPQARHPKNIDELLGKYFNTPDQLLTPALAVSIDPDTFKVARAAGVRAVLHIRLNSEPLLALGRAGLLREGDEFIHCAHLTSDAWKLIKDVGGVTSHSPPLEMAMGHGMPSIQEALDAGLRPSLSCDHCATVGQDMFGMMRTTFGLQRLSAQQRRRNGDAAAPRLITCREVIEFATAGGAECAALSHKVGTLSAGKHADIVMLRADDIGIAPMNNAYAAVANLMNPGNVDAVFVKGAVRKWGGALVDVDKARVVAMARRARDAVLKRANFHLDLVDGPGEHNGL